MGNTIEMRPQFPGQITIKRPDQDESIRILAAQAPHNDRELSCLIQDGDGTIKTITRRPKQLRRGKAPGDPSAFLANMKKAIRVTVKEIPQTSPL